MDYETVLKLPYRLILFVVYVLIHIFRMGNRDTIREKTKLLKPYSFKIFQYELVSPNVKFSKKVPLPRSGHRIVCDHKNLYSFGGYNPAVLREEDNEEDDQEEDELLMHSFPLFQELWKFNFAAGKWVRYTSRESLPQELASNAVIQYGNYLLVYGGTGSPFGYRCSNQLYVCNLSNINSLTIELNTTGAAPLPAYGQALVLHNDYLYTIGGTTGFSYTCDIHRLNLKKKSWEMVYICQGHADYEPEGRYRHEVAFDGQNIYILGGGTAEDAFSLRSVPVFNIEKLQWRKQATRPDPNLISTTNNGIPPSRRCHGSVQVETNNVIQVFICGGYGAVEIYNDLWCLNLSTFQWTLIDTCWLPYPTYFHSASVTPQGKMYIFGGIFSREDSERSNTIHSVWLCIPKLSEMCWEALLHYNPQLIHCSKNELIDSGLPRHFAQRIEF